MKRFCVSLMLMCMALALAPARDPDAPRGDVPVSRVKQVTGSGAQAQFDYDFTKINYYVASGVLFDMLVSSEKYVGKTVKINGQFLSDVYDGRQVMAVVLWDVGGCCPTGLTVVPSDGMRYPADFPESGSFATFCGVMKMCAQGEDDSLCLVVEKWD